MGNWLQQQWYSNTGWHYLLMPISWVFFGLVSARKLFYRLGWRRSFRLAVPVVVIGNINVGGTGKTPLVIWLVEQFRQAGFKPGVISRGYGGRQTTATEVYAHSDPKQVGDEPVLIAMRSHCPVFVSTNRVAAGQALLNGHPECNIIISDDGLQHYRLQRDVEIAVIDGAYGLGNKALLPAGPLREPASRLNEVDAVVVNGALEKAMHIHSVPVIDMQLVADTFYNLLRPTETCDAQSLAERRVTAIAGIGNPKRFFQQLMQMGIRFTSKAFPDHYDFKASDLEAVSADVVVMTEKDAVKCRAFAKPHFWVLPVKAAIKSDLMSVILNKIRP